MEANNRSLTAPGGHDESHTLDPAERVIAEAIADLSRVFDNELDHAEAHLTDEDHAALDALGDAEDVCRKVRERAEAWLDSESARSTLVARGAMSSTMPNSRDSTSASREDFDELMARHEQWFHKEHVAWNSHYRKLYEIGRGGQGIVYLIECQDDFSGKRALKVLSPEPYGDASSYRDDMQRMNHVASVVHQNRHDNLLEVERFASHDDIYLMVMRLIDGFDLRTLLQPVLLRKLRRTVHPERWADLNKVIFTSGSKNTVLTPGIAVNIIEKCLRGISVLHRKGIIHGDIKPSNIMLDSYGSIRLIDIGSAFAIDNPPRKHWWTPKYAAPEILDGKAWTPQADLASLGYVLLELISGQPITNPSTGSNSTRSLNPQRREDLLKAKLELPGRLGELIPKKVQGSELLMELLERMIHPDLSKRFSSAKQARDADCSPNKFKEELVKAGLSVNWVEDSAAWVANVKQACCGTTVG